MSIRLTNDIREAITSEAVSSVFDPRKTTLDALEDKLAREAYENIFTANERKQVSEIPENWLRRDSCLRFNVGGQTIELDVIGDGLPVPYKSKGESSGGYGCRVIGVVKLGDLCDRIQRHAQSIETFREEKRAAHRAISAMLSSVSTTNRLKEIWPEGEAFYAHFEEQPRAALPAVRFDEINAILGLTTLAA